MEHHVVEDESGLDLEFEGELLADEHHHDVGFVKVFQTSTGKYVMTQNLSSKPGKVVKKVTRVFGSLEEVGEELGFTRGAKAIRQRLGLKVRRPV